MLQFTDKPCFLATDGFSRTCKKQKNKNRNIPGNTEIITTDCFLIFFSVSQGQNVKTSQQDFTSKKLQKSRTHAFELINKDSQETTFT